VTKFDRDRTPPISRPRQDLSSSRGTTPVSGLQESAFRGAKSDGLEQLLRVLERYLSSVNARLLVERALREQNLTVASFTTEDLPKIGGPLRRGIHLFVKREKHIDALSDIDRICGSEASGPSSRVVNLKSEADLSLARNEARQICEELSVKSFTTHKIMTIVSELGRNIVSYATEGTIELLFLKSPNRHLQIRALDSGPGIPNLQEILSGGYRSKTGLGKGLLGTKRLADRFDISTGASGTTVVAEVLL
jgi:serine/threonine-protein kinase RsbT